MSTSPVVAITVEASEVHDIAEELGIDPGSAADAVEGVAAEIEESARTRVAEEIREAIALIHA